MTCYTWIDGPLGRMLVAASDDGVRGVWFEEQKYFPVIGAGWREDARHPLTAAAAEQLREYFDGKRRRFSLPLSPPGTPFQRRVWAALQRIEYGGTVTYGTLARQIDSPTAARAVGAAVGRNPVSVVVPCHRAVGRKGTLTGYAGGLARKRFLLELEAAR